MATVILVRHGRTTANATGMLAGRAAGVSLDEIGRNQAALTGDRLAAVPLVGVVSSPLERCRQTTQLILDRQAGTLYTPVDLDLTECDYGQWQGRRLSDLVTEDLWSTVQSQPSAVIFPGGESMVAMQTRSVAAIRRHDAAFEAEYGHVAPASASIVHYGASGPSVHAINTDAGDLSWLSAGIHAGDAPVGGGAGQKAP